MEKKIAPQANISTSSNTFGSILRAVYKSEGLKGLFRGAGARVLFHAPSTAISMATFEVFIQSNYFKK